MIRDTGRFEPVEAPRFRIAQMDGIDWISVHASKNWFSILFLCVWMAGWSVVGTEPMADLFVGPAAAKVFVGVWLIGWALGWIFAASWLGWQFGGRAWVTVQGQGLIYRWSMPFLSRTRRYDIRQIRNLRASPAFWPWAARAVYASAPPFLPMVPGSLQFDYGARTVNVMAGLDEAEARLIVDWLAERLPEGATAKV